jgi:hypothetical protein
MTALLIETTHDLTARLDVELRQQQGERLRRQVVRSLAWSADALAGIVLSAWASVREALEGEGIEGRELARYCRVVLEGIDGGLAAHEGLLTQAKAAGLTPEDAGLLGLEGRLPALREARPQVEAALALATRPARPVDEAMLSRSRAAHGGEGPVTVDDEYFARLRAGEGF